MKRNTILCSCLVILLSCWGRCVTAAEPVVLHDEALQARYIHLTDSLRCPKCENQAISSSNAPVAVDMRHHVADWLAKGYSDEKIQDELTARFGEFVLYQPRFTARTWLLWGGPALLSVIAIGSVLAVMRAHRRAVRVIPLDADERALLQRVLARHSRIEGKEHTL